MPCCTPPYACPSLPLSLVARCSDQCFPLGDSNVVSGGGEVVLYAALLNANLCLSFSFSAASLCTAAVVVEVVGGGSGVVVVVACWRLGY